MAELIGWVWRELGPIKGWSVKIGPWSLWRPVAKNTPRNFFNFFGLIHLKYDNLENKKYLETYFSVFLRNCKNSEIFVIFDLPMFSDHLATWEGSNGHVSMITREAIQFRPIRNLTDHKKVEKWLRYGHLKYGKISTFSPFLKRFSTYKFSEKIF